jgi:predicted peptidase
MGGMMLCIGCGNRATPLVQAGQHANTLGERKSPLNYLLYLPQEYQEESQDHWPLMLFLHGLGKRGDDLNDLEILKEVGPSMLIEQRSDFPFIVLSPQCPEDHFWEDHLEDLETLLEKVVDSYNVDANRIYLTGISNGGFGAWHLALRNPDWFAVVIPIAGGYKFKSDEIPKNICDLKNVPIWAFHGAKDTVVLPYQSEILVDALAACDGQVHYTLYSDADHDLWTRTYDNPELYMWLLQHTRVGG